MSITGRYWGRNKIAKIEALDGRASAVYEMDEGKIMLSFVWFEVAKRVVQRAIEIYELTPEQAAAIKKVFLRPNDYIIQENI
jgi:hypothetical protein